MMPMAMDCLICHVILIVTMTKLCIGSSPNIDSDYYYGNMVVRAGRVFKECVNNRNTQYCLLKCGNLDYECINNNCVCVKVYSSSKSRLEMHVSKKKSVEKYKAGNMHKWPGVPLEQKMLRHHIAHFCENLDLARKCIRKCMAQGKPAFCGKDHVCYCSHKQRYKNNDLINATDVYTQFKDMYLKYFGPGIFQSKPTTLKPKQKEEKKKEKDAETDQEDSDESVTGLDEDSEDGETKEKEGESEDEKGKDGEENGGSGEDSKEGEDAKDDEETKEGDEAKEGEEGGEGDGKEGEEKEKEGEDRRRRLYILKY